MASLANEEACSLSLQILGGSINNFILVMLVILTNILITTFPSSAQWVPKFPMCSPRVRVRENSPPHLCL